MSTTYRRNLRLIRYFRAETHDLKNDPFSNFDLKFLFSRYIDFAEFFLKSASLYDLYET
jgi:hypothetical protein